MNNKWIDTRTKIRAHTVAQAKDARLIQKEIIGLGSFNGLDVAALALLLALALKLDPRDQGESWS